MASYQESLLTRQVVKLQQEMISLKAPQKYLVGNAKGHVSNTVRVTSRLLSEQTVNEGTEESPVWVTYQLRGILGVFRFEGDKLGKTVIPILKFQLYSSNGQKSYPVATMEMGKVFIQLMESTAMDAPNIMEFSVDMLLTAQKPADVFYGDFWCVGNDSGILTYIRDLKRYGNE